MSELTPSYHPPSHWHTPISNSFPLPEVAEPSEPPQLPLQLPTPRPQAPFPQSHEGSSEPDTAWTNTKSCVSALPLRVSVHLVAEPLDAFPVFLRDTRVSGLILQREKNKRGRRKARPQCERALRAGSSSDLSGAAAPGLFAAERGDPG